MKSKALFLDRDGVINKEINYLHKIEDFIFVNGVLQLCEKYQSKGYKIVVITNQAGIARGFYTEKEYFILTNWMINEFLKKGINIDRVYHCPHHPEFSGTCFCRKPNPGMLKKSETELNLDLSESILIGDKLSDIEAGHKAGVGLNILIRPNKIPKELYEY